VDKENKPQSKNGDAVENRQPGKKSKIGPAILQIPTEKCSDGHGRENWSRGVLIEQSLLFQKKRIFRPC